MADIYGGFPSLVDAKEFRPLFSTFVIEWFFAVAAPAAGSILEIVLRGWEIYI